MGSIMASAVFPLLQGWHYGSRAEKLSRLSYELEFQGLRLDVLSTIREEIRDQVFVIMSSLDNLMVVSTLMLSIGFGFVVEGTFPPKSAEALEDWQIVSIGFRIDPLVVYALLCAMSLICPFWCLIFTIRMRYEVDLIVGEHMKELKRQLCNVLQKKGMQDPPKSPGRASAMEQREERAAVQREISAPLLDQNVSVDVGKSLGGACPHRLNGVLAVCPARRRGQMEDIANSVANSAAQMAGPFTISDEIKYIDQAQIVKWAEKDLLQRMSTYRFYMKAAHFLLWAGMLCAILTCSILLGLYMMETFPSTPLVWITYSTITGLNGGFAIVFALWMWLCARTVPMVLVNSVSDTPSRRSSWTQPLLEKSMSFRINRSDSGFFNCDESSLLQGNRQVTFRIRDASVGLEAYRQVAFPLGPSSYPGRGVPKADYALLESLICAKFQKQPGSYVRVKVSHLRSLVRVCDRLEVVDDEDVAQLADGDELEAVFGVAKS